MYDLSYRRGQVVDTDRENRQSRRIELTQYYFSGEYASLCNIYVVRARLQN